MEASSPNSSKIIADQKSPTPSIKNVRRGEPTTKKEIWAWWLYMAAIEPVAIVVIQLFLPLLLESLPKLVGHIAGQPNVACTGAKDEKCILFQLGGLGIGGTTFSYLIITLSVASQALLFICFGALADYGPNRRRFLAITTALGSIFCVSAFFIRGKLAALIVGSLDILITMTFGASLMLYNSYLPLLSENHPDNTGFQSDDPAEMLKRREVVANSLSTKSFMLGYGSAILILLSSALFMLFVDDSMGTLRYVIMICGGIWAVGSIYPLTTLRPRPGPKLPEGSSVLTFSLKKIFRTVRKCNKLPNTFRYLVAYFLFADGCNTIGQVAVIFARDVLDMEYSQVITFVIISPIAGVLGNLFFFFIQKRFKLPSKTTLLIILAGFTMITIYGGIGVFNNYVGLHHAWEMYLLACVYGFHMGAMQSISRVIFSELVPPGDEAEFFSLYAITDKGSSWLGPAIQVLVTQYLPNQRYGIIFLGLMIAGSLPLLIWGFDPAKGKADATKFAANEVTATTTPLDQEMTEK